ncbi:MAG: YdcF family protein [Thermoguttaceae bacterium]
MIYRFIVALVQPFPLFYLLTLVALVRLWRNSLGNRRWLLLVIVPFGILGFVSLPLVGHLALGSLEWPYPPQDKVPDDAGAIVVLSGYVRPPSDAVPEVGLGSDTLLRCLHAAQLYKARRCPILVTGGKVDPSTPGPTLARAMHDFLLGHGVKEEDLLMEERSRTTYENAVLSGDILAQKGINKIVLVTSASHMRRGERCFRALGFQVVPSACDYRTTSFDWSLSDILLPSPHSAAAVELATHEWLGVAWYWLWGRI